MLLDNHIHKHIDKIDEIEDSINKEIDKVLSSLSIELLIDDPEKTLLEAIEQLRQYLSGDVALEAINLGINFAKEVKKKKEDLIIPDSDNPNLNKEIANA